MGVLRHTMGIFESYYGLLFQITHTMGRSHLPASPLPFKSRQVPRLRGQRGNGQGGMHSWYGTHCTTGHRAPPITQDPQTKGSLTGTPNPTLRRSDCRASRHAHHVTRPLSRKFNSTCLHLAHKTTARRTGIDSCLSCVKNQHHRLSDTIKQSQSRTRQNHGQIRTIYTRPALSLALSFQSKQTIDTNHNSICRFVRHIMITTLACAIIAATDAPVGWIS